MSYRDAVLVLADRLDADVDWAVTASANLALRGYDVTPGDVDVTTDADGARAIVDAFPDAVVRPLSPPGESDADWIRSYYAILEVEGVPVDVVGDAEFRVDGAWRQTPAVAGNREFVAVDGVDVPVMSLSYERTQYRARGDDERLALIA